MANTETGFEARPIDEVKRELLERAQENRNPFLYTIFQEVLPVITGLRSVDREEWANAFGALAAPHEERAAQAEAEGDSDTARREYLIAYDCQHVARYPAPNSPGKLAAYRKSQEYFLKAARYFDPPLERVEMPFAGRAGEGKIAVGLLRKPNGVAKPPVVVVWGGNRCLQRRARQRAIFEGWPDAARDRYARRGRTRPSPGRRTVNDYGTQSSTSSRVVRISIRIASAFMAAARVVIGRRKWRTRMRHDCARR